MNYILEINAFERRMRRQPLPTTAQLLWYKLMAFANRLHWPEWFSVDNDRLTELLGSGSDKTVRTARQQLMDAGLLIYEKGVKGKPGRYKLPSISSQENQDAAAPPGEPGEAQEETQGVEGYLEDNVDLYYGYTEDIKAKVGRFTQDLFDRFRPGYKATKQDELEVFHRVIEREGSGPDGTVLSVSEDRKALLVYAFEQSSLVGAVNWRYIEGIYRNFMSRGIKTVGDASWYDAERDYRMGR